MVSNTTNIAPLLSRKSGTLLNSLGCSCGGAGDLDLGPENIATVRALPESCTENSPLLRSSTGEFPAVVAVTLTTTFCCATAVAATSQQNSVERRMKAKLRRDRIRGGTSLLGCGR